MLCIRGTSHGPVSVRHKSVFYRNGWTNRAAGFGAWASFHPSYTVLKGNSVVGGRGGSCPRVQQARGAQNCLTKNILLLTSTEVSMINSDEWAKSILSLQTLAIFCLVCLSITYSVALHFYFLLSSPVRPPQKKTLGEGALHWFCSRAPRTLVTPLLVAAAAAAAATDQPTVWNQKPIVTVRNCVIMTMLIIC